jgi:hypothetical protein
MGHNRHFILRHVNFEYRRIRIFSQHSRLYHFPVWRDPCHNDYGMVARSKAVYPTTNRVCYAPYRWGNSGDLE